MNNKTAINEFNIEKVTKYKKVYDYIKNNYPSLYYKILHQELKNNNTYDYEENIILLASDCGRG